MKAVLEFNLPEEKWEFQRASNASEAWCALHDLDAELRNMLKHGRNDGYPKTVEEMAHMIRRDYLSDVLSRVSE